MILALAFVPAPLRTPVMKVSLYIPLIARGKASEEVSSGIDLPPTTLSGNVDAANPLEKQDNFCFFLLVQEFIEQEESSSKARGSFPREGIACDKGNASLSCSILSCEVDVESVPEKDILVSFATVEQARIQALSRTKDALERKAWQPLVRAFIL